MSFLDRFKRRADSVPPLHLTIDRTYRDPEAAAITDAMAARDWTGVRRILGAAHHQDDFDFLLGAAARVEGAEEWLPDRIREEDDTLASLLFGNRLINWAWEARTAAVAELVTQDRWALFLERLQQAEEVLQEVVRREPGNVTAWNELILAARGLSLPLEEQRERFDRAVAIDPYNFQAHTIFLQGACAKWQGSHEIMHEFAHTAAAEAPEGSRLGVLVALAHWEHWLSEAMEGRSGYFKSSGVGRDLAAAADRSVLHPAYERRRNWPSDHNPFAGAFALAGQRARARQHFEILDGHGSETPWGWLKGGADAGYRLMYQRAFAS